jgi:alpha-methylacyl-CoA racemase
MGHLLAQRLDRLVGQVAQQRRVEQARRDRHHADLQPGQVAGDRQRHADDAALGRGVGRLADLPLERRHRRGVDDHAPLAVFRAVHFRGQAHPVGGQPDHVERPDQVDLDHPGEGLQRERSVLAGGPGRGADARAVDHDPGYPARQGARGVQGRVHVRRAGHVAGVERHPGPQFLGHGHAVGAGQVEDDHRRSGVVQPDGRGQAQPRRPASDQGDVSGDVHSHYGTAMNAPQPGHQGPLAGVRVIELAGIGPGPFCAMMLADAGATVLRIDRPGTPAAQPEREFLNRGRQSAVLDLKHPRAVDALLRLVDVADVLLEGFRPGVTERMGVGPEACLSRNPRLVYARMTGWGQDGPLAATAGHDIGYIARTGALHALGRAGGPPVFPANLLGDFGGGGMVMAYGICAALVERATSGRGQVVDTAIVDGVASLLAMPLMLMARGLWRDERGVNLLDGGVPWYDVYQTADEGWVAVGALEPQFYAALLDGLGLTGLPDRHDPRNWPELRSRLTARFAERTRDEWAATFAGTDACVEPVLSMTEAAADPHLVARQTYVTTDGVTEPAPAPRFSRTPVRLPGPSPVPGQHTIEALTAWGLADAKELVAAGAAVQA